MPSCVKFAVHSSNKVAASKRNVDQMRTKTEALLSATCIASAISFLNLVGVQSLECMFWRLSRTCCLHNDVRKQQVRTYRMHDVTARKRGSCLLSPSEPQIWHVVSQLWLKLQVVWDATSCWFVNSNRRFGGSCCLHLQSYISESTMPDVNVRYDESDMNTEQVTDFEHLTVPQYRLPLLPTFPLFSQLSSR
jgi:hypothetical protein